MTAASTSSGRIVSIVCLRRLPAADRNGQTLDWRITVAPFDGLNESPPPPLPSVANGSRCDYRCSSDRGLRPGGQMLMNGCLAAERTHECGCGCVCVVNDSLGKHFAAPATTQISIRLLYITSRSSHLPLPSGTPTGRCKVESKCQIASQLGTASVWPSHVTCVPLCCPTRLDQTDATADATSPCFTFRQLPPSF